MLKLGNLHFAKDGDGSKVADTELCDEIARLLGVKDLAKNLVIYRIVVPTKTIDKHMSTICKNTCQTLTTHVNI